MKKSELKNIIREVIEEGRKISKIETLISKFKKIASEQSELRKEKGELAALVNANEKGYVNTMTDLLGEIRNWDKPEDQDVKNEFLKKYYPNYITK